MRVQPRIDRRLWNRGHFPAPSALSELTGLMHDRCRPFPDQTQIAAGLDERVLVTSGFEELLGVVEVRDQSAECADLLLERLGFFPAPAVFDVMAEHLEFRAEVHAGPGPFPWARKLCRSHQFESANRPSERDSTEGVARPSTGAEGLEECPCESLSHGPGYSGRAVLA